MRQSGVGQGDSCCVWGWSRDSDLGCKTSAPPHPVANARPSSSQLVRAPIETHNLNIGTFQIMLQQSLASCIDRVEHLN